MERVARAGREPYWAEVEDTMEGTILGGSGRNHRGNHIGRKWREPYWEPYWAELEEPMEGTILGGSGGNYGGNDIGRKWREPWREPWRVPYWAEVLGQVPSV